MQSKWWSLGLAVFFIGAAYISYKEYDAREIRNQISILKYENSMLLGEINILESKPNYNDGYRDAIIKIGGPQSPGSFQDGWDAAIKVLGDNSYSLGYHTAIKQFGYTKEGNTRWLVEENIPINKNNTTQPTKQIK